MQFMFFINITHRQTVSVTQCYDINDYEIYIVVIWISKLGVNKLVLFYRISDTNDKHLIMIPYLITCIRYYIHRS
jgi:hypothetical protein